MSGIHVEWNWFHIGEQTDMDCAILMEPVQYYLPKWYEIRSEMKPLPYYRPK